MAVVVEFTIPCDAFPFGQAVSGDPDVSVSLESIVPIDKRKVPFLWATIHDSENFDTFEHTLRESEAVTNVEALTRIQDSVLYSVEWDTSEETFLNGVIEAGGALLEGTVNSTCSFTVRFTNHADLTRFHQFYQANNFPVHIDRVYTLTEEPGSAYRFDLTPAQREALVNAVENGYFAVPRETTLEEIGAELNISRQAASELVRRGAGKVLRTALFGNSSTNLDDADKE